MATIREQLAKKYTKHNFAHVAGRGFEWALLQQRPTARLYWHIAPKFYQRKYGTDLERYENPPELFRRRCVDPEKITRRSSRHPAKGVYDVGKVYGGNWDQQGSEIEEMDLFEAIKQRYEGEIKWEETSFIQNQLERVRQDQTAWRNCSSEEEVLNTCEQLDQLFESLSNDGYKSQPELRNGAPSLIEPFGFFNEYINEIAVDIGRDGELLFLDGRHRFSMVRVLGIERIPVAVIARHEQWMERREQIATGKENMENDHPDLNEFNT